MSWFKKTKEVVTPSAVAEEKWFNEPDFGPTRMWRRQDGTIEFIWLEEGSPYGARFSSYDKASEFLKELTPANFKEHLSFPEEDIIWTDWETE